jgi:uncharacterized protein YjaG (DUF416 family)
MRVYDEPALIARLEPLDRWAKTAFAAAAQRLFPLFERYAQSADDLAQAQRLAEILSAAWDVTSGLVIDLRLMESEAASMPPSDDEEWVLEMGYGQNAAFAVAYAIRTWLTDDPQEAAWAARQVYELADYAVSEADLKPGEIYLYRPGDRAEDEALKSEIVQAALSAIERDLDTVASSPPAWLELRQRAEREGRIWAATFP